VIFNSLAFLVFAAVVVPLFWALRSDRWRLPVLFAANFVFYGWWDWRFTGLLLAVVVLAWIWGIWISKVRDAGGNSRAVLLWGCGAQLAVLGYFKYANFFAENLRSALVAVGWEPGWTMLNILLPAGVSFYIFQAISYLASVHNGSVGVERSFLRMGVYLGFFPHLVAGPIIRAHLFLPQLRSERVFDAGLFWEGSRKFAIGFLYKAVFADNIAAAINPIWGSLGRLSMPILYASNSTDSAVIKLPMMVDGGGIWGAMLSGITSAGAFAAFMSTFSGLLVSMSGAFAHDIYGKILKPSAAPEDKMRMFKYAAVGIGAVSMMLGLLVESFDIAMMVGWAFAIGAASYFPLLLLGAWWRGLTAKGAATGMLVGGLTSLTAIITTMLVDKKVLTVELSPLVRSLMEQPAIWAVPLSLLLMIFVSKATAKEVPADADTIMLRLHAPEELGHSKDYIS
jgi:hypothetical protein